MASLHLLVDDEYIEEFVNSLDKAKVKVIEKNFEENKTTMQDVLASYNTDDSSFIPYYESMQDMSIWLKELEVK